MKSPDEMWREIFHCVALRAATRHEPGERHGGLPAYDASRKGSPALDRGDPGDMAWLRSRAVDGCVAAEVRLVLRLWRTKGGLESIRAYLNKVWF